MTQPQAEAGVRPHCVQPTGCKATGAGHCRSCTAKRINADPEIQARRIARIREKHAEPEFRAVHAERCTARIAAVRERLGPEWLREQGRKMQLASMTPEGRAAVLASRPAAGRARTNTVLAWCPPIYRDEYRRLSRSGNVTAAEARAMIEATVASEGKRLVERAATEMQRRHQREKTFRFNIFNVTISENDL